MENPDVKSLKRKLSTLKGSLTRIFKFIKSDDQEINKISLKSKLEILGGLLPKYEESYFNVIELIGEEEGKLEDSEYIQFEEQFYLTKHMILDRLKGLGEQEMEIEKRTDLAEVDRKVEVEVRLPKMDIGKFAGKNDEWLQFYETFKAVIHENSKLKDIQKFHYLISCVEDEAAEIINGITVSHENYEFAWNKIVDHYKNNKILVETHMGNLFEFKKLERQSAVGLRELHYAFVKNLNALSKLGISEVENNVFLVYLLTTKLDSRTLKSWEETTASSKEMPSYKRLEEFLIQQYNWLESYEKKNNKETKPVMKGIRTTTSLGSNSNTCKECKICGNKNHPVYKCPKFLKESVDGRRNLVSKFGCCWQCLSYSHGVAKCTGRSCSKCNRKHNYLLCKDTTGAPYLAGGEPAQAATTSGSPLTITGQRYGTNSKPNHPSACYATSIDKECVRTVQLFPFASIVINTEKSGPILGRFLLDSASELNFISEKFVRKLKTKIQRENMKITGIGCLNTHSSGYISGTVSSRTTNYSKDSKFYVLGNILEGPTLNQKINIQNWNLPEYVSSNLADPESYLTNNEIDGILGIEIFFDIILGEKFYPCNKTRGPYYLNTLLGWVLVGETDIISRDKLETGTYVAVSDEVDALEVKLDQPVSIAKRRLEEDVMCEQVFKTTTRVHTDGRFIVALPFKAPPENLGNSFNGAKKRFSSLELKFSKMPKLKEAYSNFIQEYLNLGHMEKIPREEISVGCNYYLPHHAVYKESTTTSLRVVFNASFKCDNGVSLNDILMVGPALQNDVSEMLLAFRFPKYGLIADVAKMYRQIWVNENDRDFQRIVWRDDPEKPLEHFRLKTVTYGTGPAPFLAIRCLHRIAEDIATQDSDMAEIIKKCFFMDDLITGANTVEEVLQIHTKLSEILGKHQFFLRKWGTNSEELFHMLSKNTEDEHFCLNIEDGSIKTLGIRWDPKPDKLIFKLQGWALNKVTKRTILADLHKFWDPIGLLTPVLIKGKMFLQELWKKSLSWDDELPEELGKKWIKFKGKLENSTDIQVPRRVIEELKELEIHGFCDSSEKAYGASIYARSRTKTGHIRSRLILAKARVCPLNSMTLPRCELLGAVLLIKLLSSLLKVIKDDPVVHCWTDSEIVLSWIHGCPQQWKTFVAHRVAYIREYTQPEQWHFVPSKENPADIASRGISPLGFENNELWWNGPKFLLAEVGKWPIWKESKELQSDVPETRRLVYSLAAAKEANAIFTRYSAWRKLVTIVAYILRFYKNVKISNVEDRTLGQLSVLELEEAKQRIIKLVQADEFPMEVSRLTNKLQLKKDSKLLPLLAIIDENGIIRVGGRLNNANISEPRKHPIILPYKHKVTQLIMEEFHRRYFHVGPQALLSLVRGEYWPINGKSAAKAVVHGCITCRKAVPTALQPRMAALPRERVTPRRCFEIAGVDFCGPIWIKVGMRKTVKQKAYIAVFVCFVVKAVHIEVVTDLSGKAFLAALRRFFARRGTSKHMYSDNGTNFVGAQRELGQLLADAMIHRECAELGTKWHFTPPGTPHFGGIWEASVKVIKRHMLKTVGNMIMTYEEAVTLLTGIEACLNSRPLTPLSDDPKDPMALTPAHFLIGGPIHLPPEPDLTERQPLVQRWQRIQQLTQGFWKRWSTEYLSGLQRRNKWRFQRSELPVGTLVSIKEENLKPTQWRLARVVALHPGLDGITRVASVVLSGGQVIKRPLVKLCPILEVDEG